MSCLVYLASKKSQKMAAQIQTQIRKFEDILKGYLYEGPLVPVWGLLEQKTKVKRERLALGISPRFQ